MDRGKQFYVSLGWRLEGHHRSCWTPRSSPVWLEEYDFTLQLKPQLAEDLSASGNWAKSNGKIDADCACYAPIFIGA